MNRTVLGFTVLLVLTMLYTCTPSPRFTTRPEPDPAGAESGEPKSARKTPPELSTHFRPGQSIIGVSSYYGRKFHGRPTANGETFDMYGISAAHRTLPFNTVLRVTNLANNESLIVRVNDRGPFVPGRILDLSYAAAKELGFVVDGTATVKVEIVELGSGEYVKDQ